MIIPLMVSGVVRSCYDWNGETPCRELVPLDKGAYLVIFGPPQYTLKEFFLQNLPKNYKILFDERAYNAVHDESPNRLNIVIFDVE
jgi:hypothetical protein